MALLGHTGSQAAQLVQSSVIISAMMFPFPPHKVAAGRPGRGIRSAPPGQFSVVPGTYAGPDPRGPTRGTMKRVIARHLLPILGLPGFRACSNPCCRSGGGQDAPQLVPFQDLALQEDLGQRAQLPVLLREERPYPLVRLV